MGGSPAVLTIASGAFAILLAWPDAARSTAQDAVARQHPLVGRWTWTLPANRCVEVYDYRGDGTFSVISGQEHSDGIYKVSAEPDAAGFYLYTDKVTRDHGGMDCAESAEDQTGEEGRIYILLHASGNEILMCYEPSLDKCFGPLNRVRGK